MHTASKPGRVAVLSRQPHSDIFGYGDYALRSRRGRAIMRFCSVDFHKYTDIRLKPGERVKVRINIEVVE